MRALFVLTPHESKRLIGKAVASLDVVSRAKDNGMILIAHGSTNLYVAEEIIGRKQISDLMDRNTYLSGLIVRGTMCATYHKEKPDILLLRRGEPVAPAPTMSEVLNEFGKESVIIKGANAVDPNGNAGTLLAHPEGGTIGWAMGMIVARGLNLLVPVGLEKLVPSVNASVDLLGQERLDYVQGNRVGMMPLAGAKVITEIQALESLFDVEASHVASGGVGGSEGCVSIVVRGEERSVEKAISLHESLKGEPPLEAKKGLCHDCPSASAPLPDHITNSKYPKRCRFHELVGEELPPYLRER